MPGPSSSSLLTDADGIPIPQIYNPQTQSFQPLEGRGSASSAIRGSYYQVGAGATATVIPLVTTTGMPMALTAAAQAQWVGAILEAVVTIGGVPTLAKGIVTAVTSAGVVTLDSALGAAPASAAPVLIVPPDPSSLVGSNALSAALQAVTTAGTRVQLPSIACREVTLIGLAANTGAIYVGGSNVSSLVYGAALDAKDSITLPVSNANLVYIDADVSGEGISYVAV